MQEKAPLKDPLFERKAGKGFLFELAPHLLHIGPHGPPRLGQVDTRDALNGDGCASEGPRTLAVSLPLQD